MQAKFFADAGEKTQRKFGEKFCRFSPFNFQEKWLQEISRKIVHIFHKGRNKILSLRDSGRGVPRLSAIRLGSDQPLSEHGFAYGLKRETCQFSKILF